MLFAAEGGGFLSSSASGYSKGLTFLLLGEKNEEKGLRISTWNHYQLVGRKSDFDLQLASSKDRISHGCASFVCFGHASAEVESPSPLQVGPAQEQSVAEKVKDHEICIDDGRKIAKSFALKSSLKKRSVAIPIPGEDANGDNRLGQIERRKVQWTDTLGIELAEVREFEPSEMGLSDDEIENGSGRRCMCAIM